MPADLASLEVKIGYRFSKPEMLRRALIHSSHAHEVRSTPEELLYDNQRLEFLGDAVLGFLVADALVERFPGHREGELSALKAHLVSATHLYGVARRLDLGAYLELGRSEEMSGGRAKKTLLVDALEAVLAAIYLDGGIEPVRRFVTGQILDAHFEGDRESDTDIQPAVTNYKSALQELAQARKLPAPRYSIVRERGPQHSKTFTIEVSVGADLTAQAEGRTKKVAAQRAARGVYERLLASQRAPGSAPGTGAAR
ncbi:MAG TPA: ribonuclease III [Bryobacteraceae bacterium]|jgi:ribonuclease-3